MGLRVSIYGFGEIGRILAEVALLRGHELVGVIDVDPRLVGRDAGELLNMGKLGLEVTKNVEEGLRGCEVVLHATGSNLRDIYGQLADAIRLGKSIISTCETLAYPYYRYPILARKLDELARSRGSTLIGSGINPGFLLDTLAIIFSAPLPRIKRITARRCLDASKRRASFRRKIGLGLEPSEFLEGLRRGTYTGHIGYAESVCLIADAAGLTLTRVTESQDPLIAEGGVRSRGLAIEAGRIRGIKGCGVGYVNDVERIRVELQASIPAQDYEEIRIEGEEHSITWRSSGTPGDLGTASVILSLSLIHISEPTRPY